MSSPASTSAHSQNSIRISEITVRLNAHRPPQSGKITINGTEKHAKWDKVGKNAIAATFQPSWDISSSDRLELIIHSSLFKNDFFPVLEKDIHIKIDAGQLLNCHSNAQGQQEWRQSFEKAEIIVCLSHEGTSHPPAAGSGIIPTTNEIASICPRFRILVAGRSGVGKSSLINEAFGVTEASVSHAKAGKADINKEIFSSQNEQFVLHDSQGFEPGEVSNPMTVRGFINTRNRMPNLKDRLHAIWLCIAIPVAGGRVFETGLEELFEQKKQGHLGSVPIIAVFTKLDALVDREERELALTRGNELGEKEIHNLARDNADKAFKESCLSIFQTTVGSHIPYMAVSTQGGYKNTLSTLIEITFDHVKDHVAKEASIVTAIAQRISPSVKIQASIDVGRKKYWAGLATGINFPNKKLEDCLDVIHTDIINVWNQDDPHRHLKSEEFKAMMSNLVGDKLEQGIAGTDNASARGANPNRTLTASAAMLGAITGIVGGLSGPAAPIVIPIVGGLALAVWVYQVYKASQNGLEHLMAYIVDLTLVMQNVFWLAEGKHPTSRRMIKLAFKAYYESSTKLAVHDAIVKHVKQAKIYAPGTRDSTLDKLVEIIDQYKIDSTEMWRLRGDIPAFEASGPDEPWETQPEPQSFRRFLKGKVQR